MRSIARYLPVIFLSATGCSSVGAAGEAEHPRVTPTIAAAPGDAPPVSYGEMGRVEGQAGGIGYFEFATRGARLDEPLPMIIVMHGRGGRTEKFETMFASFPARARIIVAHGYANGRGGYNWWDPRVPGTDPEVLAAAVRPMESQMAGAIAELRARRPTVGRPIVTGFSQGGMLAFSLAAMHPDLVAAAFPLGGLLPVRFAGNHGATRPFVRAFHGVRDGTVPIARTRSSIDELRRFGYDAELTEYPALGHKIGAEELRAAMAQMAALASRPGGP